MRYPLRDARQNCRSSKAAEAHGGSFPRSHISLYHVHRRAVPLQQLQMASHFVDLALGRGADAQDGG